jgi:hypothetical protein
LDAGGVAVLVGVLLPPATVFLLMLCNDRAVLGPWVNSRKTNAFTGAVITVLITLSVVLTASVMFPAITAAQIVTIMAACAAAATAAGGWLLVGGIRGSRNARLDDAAPTVVAGRNGAAGGLADRMMWRMPPLAELPAPVITGARRAGLIALRGYLAIAMILVIVKVVLMAVAH